MASKNLIKAAFGSRLCRDGFQTRLCNFKIPKRKINILSTLFLIFLFIASFTYPSFGDEKKKTINKITIKRYNVINENNNHQQNGNNSSRGSFHKFTAGLINGLHIVTQEEIIRRELLFQEGDLYDEKIVEESERNLRSFGFLGEAKITAEEMGENRVNILVKTYDQWTTMIGTSFKSVGDQYFYSLDLGEKNLLGRAYEISYRLKHKTQGNSQEVKIINPRVANSRIHMEFNNFQEKNNNISGLEIKRPFFSLSTSWSYGVKGEQRETAFDGTQEENYNLHLFLARSFGETHKTRFIPAFDFGKSTFFDHEQKKETKNKNKLEITLEFLFNSDKYAKTSYLDKFGRTEDVFLGNTLNLIYGKEYQLFGSSDKKDTFSMKERKIIKTGGENNFLIMEFDLATHKGFVQGDYQLTSHQLDLRYYYKEFTYQTIVLHANGAFSEQELVLGGENGLRGYNPEEFMGSKKFLFNIEDRLFIYKKFLTQLVEPGATIFFDSGFTWKDGEAVNFKDLKSSLGIGLRFYMVKSANYNIINLNVAYPLNLHRGIVLTLGTSGSF